ncbi:MAG TPA: hypothetical protein VJV05_12025 [Pyrinomonadaceae bacterium]|nr:hypothetical protein [Pyrinomonadaceae bacterium]
MSILPPVLVWAWERPENLEGIDTTKVGVAFLAQTLTLSGDDVRVEPRRQPLNVRPGTKLVAVTRIEARKKAGGQIALSEKQREKIVTLVSRTLELPDIIAVQIDYDVVVSEREFYRKLLNELRSKLPDDVPLSITSLASFCLGDRWLDGLPIDEAIPMIFRMGSDDREIKQHFESGGDVREPLCRASYGISLDEPFKMQFDSGRRIYVFNDRPWNDADLRAVANLNQK